MKSFSLVLGFVLASLLQAHAQISVEVALDQEQFLGGEALPTTVRITNRSGQTLHLGGERGWLTFSVESREGFIVVKTGEVPVDGTTSLESSQVATYRVDLAPYFVLPRQGRYSVTATMWVKEWGQQVTSKPASFDIISGAKLLSFEFGVPSAVKGDNTPPEVRKFTLEQANYLRSQVRLYLRLTDASESKVFKVYAIGPMVSFGQPEAQLDKDSHFHVIYQNGARTFNYTVFNPDGEVITRQTYDYISARPRLKSNDDGVIGVVGGQRRISSDDVPAPTVNPPSVVPQNTNK